jgi:DNA-binding response OmpR family regulator
MSNESQKILIVDDDADILELLTYNLAKEGYNIKTANNGLKGVQIAQEFVPDLIMLDIMMPKQDGFSLAREIRLRDPAVPLIFITARSLREDKIRGYGTGADDYILKPFDEEELVLKIRALLRRLPYAGIPAGHAIRAIGRYAFDPGNQSLTLDGVSRRITEKECRVLLYLSDRRNQVVRREDLLKTIWGENDYFFGRSLDVFISKIRKYLKDDSGLSVENVFGVGFILNAPVAPDTGSC